MFLSQGKVFYNTETGRAFNPNMGVEFDPENPVDTLKDDGSGNSPNRVENQVEEEENINKKGVEEDDEGTT